MSVSHGEEDVVKRNKQHREFHLKCMVAMNSKLFHISMYVKVLKPGQIRSSEGDAVISFGEATCPI
jgi:hypothetical protein